MAKQVLIVTIVTNGVSFTLVAGAICSINFSNKLNTFRNACTLNISSTGAKTITQINDHIAMSVGTKDVNSSTFVAGPGLTVYNGSTYRILLLQPYNDYTD